MVLVNYNAAIWHLTGIKETLQLCIYLLYICMGFYTECETYILYFDVLFILTGFSINHMYMHMHILDLMDKCVN